ncbi:MAG: aminotransferase class V-fold PLP-dependent enzyme, partial [Rhodospirillales bacterium]|nr:aminotransferase class V-fold PLP-dependent enzyme [Rhodospirillales bacterium]
MNTNVYLDHNASAPLRPEAIAAIESAMNTVGNGSSVHAGGRAARKIIEEARSSVARLCSTDTDTVTFTSGGTEANNLVLSGSGRSRVLISAVEHPSV